MCKKGLRANRGCSHGCCGLCVPQDSGASSLLSMGAMWTGDGTFERLDLVAGGQVIGGVPLEGISAVL
jgi:hypothetical protein